MIVQSDWMRRGLAGMSPLSPSQPPVSYPGSKRGRAARVHLYLSRQTRGTGRSPQARVSSAQQSHAGAAAMQPGQVLEYHSGGTRWRARR